MKAECNFNNCKRIAEDISAEVSVWTVHECADKSEAYILDNVGYSLFGMMDTSLAVKITSRHNQEFEVLKSRLRGS